MSPGETPIEKTPPTPKLWAVPPFPATGDAKDSLTFEAVGRALSQWEHFEAYFGLVFGAFVGAVDQTEPALRAYGTIVSFKGRCGMVEEAAKAHFLEYPDNILEPRFKKLAKAADGWASRRNEIAHGIVQPYVPPGRDAIDGWALVPSYHATNKRRLAAAEGSRPHRIELNLAYTSAELEKFRAAFEALAKEAEGLHAILYSVMRR